MSNNEKLWGAQFDRPDADIFYDSVTKISTQMEHAKKLGGILVSHDNERGKAFTRPIPFSAVTDDFDGTRQNNWYRSELHVDERKPNLIFLAIHKLDREGGVPTSRHDMRDFIITAEGTVQRVEATTVLNQTIEDSNDYDYAIVNTALGTIDRTLASRIEYRKRELVYEHHNRQKRRRTIRNRLIGGGAIVATLAGATFGIYHWVRASNDNRRAEIDIRAEYDQGNPMLDGEPVAIGGHEFTIIPKETFGNIPTYGYDDNNLKSPRVIKADDGCAKLPGTYSSGTEIIAALPEGSIYSFSEYTTSFDGGGAVQLCLVEPVVSSGSVSDDDFLIAVQEK